MRTTFAVAAVTVALFAASARAQNDVMQQMAPPAQSSMGRVTMKKVDSELKTAGEAVEKYDRMVHDFKSGRLSKASMPNTCEQTFQPSSIYSVPPTAKVPYVRPAIRYEGCIAVAMRLPQPCFQLSRLDPSAVASCQQTLIRFNLIRTLRAHKPEAHAACREWLTQQPQPAVATQVPSSRYDAVCEAMETGRDADDVLSRISAIASSPVGGEAAGELRRFMNILIGGDADCGDQGNFCKDAVATSRAARSNNIADCGPSVFCRAAVGGGEKACMPLLSDLRKSFCDVQTARAAGTSESADPVTAALHGSYETANAAVVQVVADAEMLEPRNSEECKSRLERARSLRKRLDDVPHWSSKKPAARGAAK